MSKKLSIFTLSALLAFGCTGESSSTNPDANTADLGTTDVAQTPDSKKDKDGVTIVEKDLADDAATEEDMSGDFGNQNSTIELTNLKAFPTAEGAGKMTSGGRGGIVKWVTTHENADGLEGSLYNILKTHNSDETPVTIMFAVGGVFPVREELWVNGTSNHITVAGQSANELGGVQFRVVEADPQDCDESNETLALIIYNAQNFVLRYMSFKGGFERWWYSTGGFCNRNTAFRMRGIHKLIIDHFTGAYGAYSVGIGFPTANKFGDITIQNSLGIEGSSGHNVGAAYVNPPNAYSNFETWRDSEQESTWWGNGWLGISHRQNGNMRGGSNYKNMHTKSYVNSAGSRTTSIGMGGVALLEDIVYENLSSGYDPRDTFRYDFDFSGNGVPDSHLMRGKTYANNLSMKGTLYKAGTGGDDDSSELFSLYGSSPVPSQYSSEPIGGLSGGDPVPDFYLLEDRPGGFVEVPNIPLSDVKDYVLNYAGAGVRFDENGKPFQTIYEDKLRINLAQGKSALDGIPDEAGLPNLPNASVHEWRRGPAGGDENDVTKLGLPARMVYANVENKSRTLSAFETKHGFPEAWAEKHNLGSGDDVHNETKTNWSGLNGKYKVINTAGYTHLEIYLAELAGDFHMLQHLKQYK